MIKNSANKYFPKIQATCIGLPLAKLLPVHGTDQNKPVCPARFERATYALEEIVAAGICNYFNELGHKKRTV